MTGIAAPEPQITVTVLGLTVDHVRVVETRRTRSDIDVVRVTLADVTLAGPLHQLQLVVAKAAEGLVEVEAARRGPEGMVEP